MTTYDETVFEEADMLLHFGNAYDVVIEVANGTFVIQEDSFDWGTSGGQQGPPRNLTPGEERERVKRQAQNFAEDKQDDVKKEKNINHAIKALTAAAAAVTGGAVVKSVTNMAAKAASKASNAANAAADAAGGAAKSGGGNVANIVALAAAVVTAAGAVGQHIHDKERVQKIKADAVDELDEKLDDITVKLNEAGPSEKRNLLVARDALKKAKNSVIKM